MNNLKRAVKWSSPKYSHVPCPGPTTKAPADYSMPPCSRNVFNVGIEMSGVLPGQLQAL
jgi:hypothetical protein